jgi:hypothetical protein
MVLSLRNKVSRKGTFPKLLLVIVFISTLGFSSLSLASGETNAPEKPYRSLLKTLTVPPNSFEIDENYVVVPLRFMANVLPAKISWDGASGIITFDISPSEFMGKELQATTISFIPTERAEEPSHYVVEVNGQLFYHIPKITENGALFLPLYCVFEPLFEVIVEQENLQVHLYDNPAFHRVKLLPFENQIISDYTLHDLASLRDEEASVLYVGLNDFFSALGTSVEFRLQPPRLLYRSLYLKKAFCFDLESTSLHLIDESGDLPITSKVELENDIRIDDEQPYLSLPDLITIMNAQTPYYEDSEKNRYLTFEW